MESKGMSGSGQSDQAPAGFRVPMMGHKRKSDALDGSGPLDGSDPLDGNDEAEGGGSSHAPKKKPCGQDPATSSAASRRNDSTEIILAENKQRFVLHPITHERVWEMYIKHQLNMWFAGEVDLSGDVTHWKTRLNDAERHFIKWVLAFFAGSDGIVAENLAVRFLQEVQIPEARCFVRGSLVSMADGTSKPIESITVGERVLGWSEKTKRVVPASVTHLKPKPGATSQSTVRVTLEDGRTIQCTPDHRFLVEGGSYVEAHHLAETAKRVAVTCDFPTSFPLDDVDSRWKLSLGSLGSLGSLDVGRENLKKTLAFARLCGLLLTAGSVGRDPVGRLMMRCWARTALGKEFVLDDIERLCGARPNAGRRVTLPERLGHAIYETDPVAFYETDPATIQTGTRVSKPFCLPTWVTRSDCPKIVVAEFLGGLFGGAGHAPRLSGAKGTSHYLSNVAFSQTRNEEHEASLTVGFGQILTLLARVGVTMHFSRVVTPSPGKKTLMLETVDGRGTLAFAERVGFRYDANKMVRLAVARSFFRMRQDTGTGTVADVEEWLSAVGALPFMRETLPVDAKDSVKSCSPSLPSHTVKMNDTGLPAFFLKVRTVTPMDDEHVYDLSVEDPIHSFVVAGAIVHNCFYGFQLMMENIHSEMYSLMLQTYVTEPKERALLFGAIETIPAIKAKADWALKWISSPTASFAERLLAFACVEGIFFSGSFCAIFWLRERGVMPGLCLSNDLISRDEALHCDFALLLYSMLKHKLQTERVHEMWQEAVAIEKQFILDALPCSLLGMNSTQMSMYIEYVGDRLLKQAGYPVVWNRKECPFPFMAKTSFRTRSNFFELRVGEYQNPHARSALIVHPSSYAVLGDAVATSASAFSSLSSTAATARAGQESIPISGATDGSAL